MPTAPHKRKFEVHQQKCNPNILSWLSCWCVPTAPSLRKLNPSKVLLAVAVFYVISVKTAFELKKREESFRLLPDPSHAPDGECDDRSREGLPVSELDHQDNRGGARGYQKIDQLVLIL